MIILIIILYRYYILEAIARASSKLRHILLSCPYLLFVRSIPFSSGQMNRRLFFANDCTFQSYCAVMDPFHNIKGPRISTQMIHSGDTSSYQPTPPRQTGLCILLLVRFLLDHNQLTQQRHNRILLIYVLYHLIFRLCFPLTILGITSMYFYHVGQK